MLLLLRFFVDKVIFLFFYVCLISLYTILEIYFTQKQNVYSYGDVFLVVSRPVVPNLFKGL